ncbi:zinc finger matrin-type protein 1 isoform X2 [Pristis pectinata]|nr:zinc finger matrin-type protein 1 isoform X2 [Pristis pectinata]XP_051866328.1 zinc finger matrin-type protein 1 isoform X2 [Pristis pectinata]
MGGHDSELFMDNYCRVCCAMLISEVQRTTHYESKKHANKVRFYFQTHKEEGTPSKRLKTENVTVGFQDTGIGGMDKNKFCLLCNMVFTSPTAAQFHYQGKVHAKKLKQLVGKQPSVTQPHTVQCSITVSTNVANTPSEQITSVQSEQPEKDNQEMTQETSAAASTALDQEDPNKFCKLCNASFNNPLMAQQHYIGKKHKKNETRRQLMEEMGKGADSSEKNGHFSCAICNVTLNSIKQYQSHVQGYKHQFKENEVANLVKNTKSKKYDSFQDELDDFIKVQKARGLVPKVCFRKFEDNLEEEEEEEAEEEKESRGLHLISPLQSSECSFEVKQGIPAPNPSGFQHEQPLPVNVETKVPQWPPLQGDRSRIQSLQNSGLHMEYYAERLPPLKLTCPENAQDPHGKESADECKPVSSDDSTGSYKKDKRGRKKKHRRDKRNKDTESKRDSEYENYRKEKSAEALGLEPDTNQTDQKPDERDKEELMLSKGEKMKHKKDKKDQYLEKEDIKQRQKKQKKRKEVDARTEEEKLWDESILGI